MNNESALYILIVDLSKSVKAFSFIGEFITSIARLDLISPGIMTVPSARLDRQST